MWDLQSVIEDGKTVYSGAVNPIKGHSLTMMFSAALYGRDEDAVHSVELDGVVYTITNTLQGTAITNDKGDRVFTSQFETLLEEEFDKLLGGESLFTTEQLNANRIKKGLPLI